MLVIRSFSFGNFEDIRHVLHPSNVVFEEFLEGQGASYFDYLLLVSVQPWNLQLQKQQSKITQRLQIILPAFWQPSQLVVACKRGSIKLVDNLKGMSFDINIPQGSFQVYRNQLPLLIYHKVLGFYITIEISTIVDELEDLQNIYKDRFRRQPHYVSSITLDDHIGAVFTLKIQNTVNAGPLGLGNILPEPVIHLQNRPQSICRVFQCNMLRISFGVAIEDSAKVRLFELVVTNYRADSLQVHTPSVVIGVAFTKTSLNELGEQMLAGTWMAPLKYLALRLRVLAAHALLALLLALLGHLLLVRVELAVKDMRFNETYIFLDDRQLLDDFLLRTTLYLLNSALQISHAISNRQIYRRVAFNNMRLLRIFALDGDCFLAFDVIDVVADEVAHDKLLIQQNFIALSQSFIQLMNNKLMIVVD